MTQKKVILLIGTENTDKISILNKIESNNHLIIPPRFTNDPDLISSSLYVFRNEASMKELYNQKQIKSIGFTPNGKSALASNFLSQAFAQLYNGKGEALIINIAPMEFVYYQKHYPQAIIIGCGSPYEQDLVYLFSAFHDFINYEEELDEQIDEHFHPYLTCEGKVLSLKK